MANAPVDDSEEKQARGRRKPRLMLELPPDVKEALDRSAYANARTRTAEIVLRLRSSFDADPVAVRQGHPLHSAERQPALAGWLGSPARELAVHEQQLVAQFRKLNERQRAALLVLLSEMCVVQ